MAGPTERVAVYAGSFDPPGLHHRTTAELLARRFDRVVVLPNGPRPDRPEPESLPIHRAVTADLNFKGLVRVEVDLADLEAGRFTPNHEFDGRFGGPGKEVWHVVPAAAVRGGAVGRARVQQEWDEGPGLWAGARFVVLHEPNEPVDPADLPPHAARVEVPFHVPSTAIRETLFAGGEADRWMHPAVAGYVRRHGLFRLTPPAPDCGHRVAGPRLKICYDPHREEARKIADRLREYESPDPDVIVVVGGDGTMLKCIRQHWRLRVPFYGLNVGHLGFLLNDPARVEFWAHDLRLYQLPLLWVETVCPEGTRTESLAFNDCWVERETGQTAWVEVGVNGAVRMPRVVADGMLVATAAGSTSYARAMGATPLPFNAPLLTLAGSNVLKPESWRPAVLTNDARVTIRCLDLGKRPLRGFIDGVGQGPVARLTARVSNVAAVELLFDREHDPVAKLAVLQFPQPG